MLYAIKIPGALKNDREVRLAWGGLGERKRGKGKVSLLVALSTNQQKKRIFRGRLLQEEGRRIKKHRKVP